VGYCIVENSSEDILVGKPTLDSLGFVSDKHSIELRTVGIRFGTVLPEEAANREVSYLRLAENVAFEVPPGQNTTKTVEVVTRTEHNRDKWWSQPGVDLQPELQLVEGPLVVNNGRASIDILVHGNLKLPAGARVAEARREQKAGAKLIQMVTAERGKQKEQFLRMEECRQTLARGQAEERLEHQIKTGELSEEMQARLMGTCGKAITSLHRQGDAPTDQSGPGRSSR